MNRTSTHPPVDPELAAVLAAAPRLAKSLLPSDIPALRAHQQRLGATDDMLGRAGAIEFSQHRVPTDDGAEIEALVLRPATGDGPWPGVCYLHGGGMVVGDCRTGIELVLDWVERVGVVVVSVGYRLAPEHPYPVPLHDAYAGLAWAATNAAKCRIAPGELIVAGSSAGGGLAAGTALLARDLGWPPLSDQILMSPMLDDRAITPSSTELDGGGVWDRRSNETGWDALLGEARGSDGVPAYAAPARATDLAGLPATYLDVGSAETFRDETLDYGARLAWAGAFVEMHLWPGGFHGFDHLAPSSRLAAAARRARLDYLERRLGERATS